ncbi:MAG: hypothetical protein B6D64_11485 [Bacteroidetes bacterium 4484_276]|nr:MAG: hypothetical protein B6D64_11485 [Bacteroidetes bacterium 4484_276]OYT12646.1 MAG: hypothetical protein B6I19_09290 [Bacteroidetes bacterium 4572_114]
MKIKRILILTCLFFSVAQFSVFSQQADTVDKPEVIPMIFPSYAFQWPAGDMVARFGANSTIGPGFLVKTGGNWLIGADVNFIFGNKMKEDSLFQNLLTSQGYIIDQQGQYADLSLFERGFYSSVKLGKIIPIFGSNINSGLMLLAGAGYLQHKIRIEVIDNSAPQLSGDYKKGYDRFTDGFQINQFVGYMHIGESKLANFFIGMEFVQAWTMNRRSMNFDEGRRDDKKRLDMLYGIKVGWVIPFRTRMPNDFYYY